MRTPERASTPQLSTDRLLLEKGEIEVKGRMPWASNATLLVELSLEGRRSLAVHKPGAGERPLWDYPGGLYRREVAVSLLDAALGWNLVPTTLLRDGPFGPGSVQQFVATDNDEHYFSLLERPEHHETLRAIATLDLLVNNGDRKSGHCLLDADGRVWAIDHGLCLHADPKLRTVIWDFAGQPIPPALLDDLARVVDDLAAGRHRARPGLSQLDDLIDADERRALARRALALLQRPIFPAPRTSRAYPWPLL